MTINRDAFVELVWAEIAVELDAAYERYIECDEAIGGCTAPTYHFREETADAALS